MMTRATTLLKNDICKKGLHIRPHALKTVDRILEHHARFALRLQNSETGSLQFTTRNQENILSRSLDVILRLLQFSLKLYPFIGSIDRYCESVYQFLGHSRGYPFSCRHTTHHKQTRPQTFSSGVRLSFGPNNPLNIFNDKECRSVQVCNDSVPK